MIRARFIIALFCISATTGCATIPAGPSVHVFPGSEKNFEEFQLDDATCRAWAGQRIGLAPDEIRNQSTISGAGVGAILGAGLGALIGSASGNAGIGAAIGAGSGLLIGSAAGADSGRVYGYEAQRRYDSYYLQCMYAKGNQVPGIVAPRQYRQYKYAPPLDARPAPPGTPSPVR
jgi:hypothetical protein